MSTFTTTMFASIKDALQKDTKGTSGFGNIMRFEKGNSYVVRLLPNVTDPSKTFFHYYAHGWESFATGQYISLISPQTFGERDPIAEFRYQTNRSGTPADKNKVKAISRVEKWLVNVYVVDDPVNPENNGKVKIARYGKQLHNVIMEAISGEDSAELGEKIFDLGPEGNSLRIKVEDQGGYPTYVSSKFLMPSSHGLPGDSAATLSTAHVLDEVFNMKSYDELVESLNEHYHCAEAGATKPADPEVNEEVSFDTPPAASATSSDAVSATKPETVEEPTGEGYLDDDKIRELLKGLDD